MRSAVLGEVVSNDKSDLRWGTEQRLDFIEFRLYWEEHVNRSDLVGKVRVSVNQAYMDVNRYIGFRPMKAGGAYDR